MVNFRTVDSDGEKRIRSLSFTFPGTTNGRFEISWQNFLERLRFIFSFLRRKNNYVFQF